MSLIGRGSTGGGEDLAGLNGWGANGTYSIDAANGSSKMIIKIEEFVSTNDEVESFFFTTPFPNGYIGVSIARTSASATLPLYAVSGFADHFEVNRPNDITGSQPFRIIAFGY